MQSETPEISNSTSSPIAAGEPTQSSAADRLKWRLLSVVAAILPGFGAAYASRRVIGVFEELATGSGGVGSVFMGLYESNRPVIMAGVAATVFSTAIALMVARKAERAWVLPGPIFSVLIALASCVPALLLWNAESFTIKVICNQVTGPAADASQYISTLLIATVACGFWLPLLLVVAASISRLFPPRPQTAASVRVRILTWAFLAILAAGITTAFFVRSSAFHEAAQVGTCQGIGLGASE